MGENCFGFLLHPSTLLQFCIGHGFFKSGAVTHTSLIDIINEVEHLITGRDDVCL